MVCEGDRFLLKIDEKILESGIKEMNIYQMKIISIMCFLLNI